MFAIFENIVSSLEIMWGSKLRSGLTMLGVVIGVFAVVMLVALGEGAKKYVIMQVESMGIGAHTLMVRPGKKGQQMRGQSDSLKYEDCTALRHEIPEIVELTPFSVGQAEVKYGPFKRTTSFFGVGDSYPIVTNREMLSGRFFGPFEVNSRRKIIVIGTKIMEDVFKGMDPVGERMTISGEKYTVIGVMAPKGRIGEMDLDDMCCIPFTTATSLFKSSRLSRIVILANGPEAVPKVSDHVYEVLAARHGKIDFFTRTQGEVLKKLDMILGTLTTAVVGIAAISLIVGGVGIMNIMLVSVTERTREIGVRKSVGATNGDIFQQFLVESGIIGLIGGASGLGLSLFCCAALGYALGFEFVTPVWSMVLGLTFSAFVGVVSGVYPAMRAARQDPIEALRYD
ncbi:MAG TPA: ABC transporter permease [Candidatus Brocadiia bacterium]|nr:ABC transporter permease [Candidatus Brocadiia bacterium]